MPPPPASDAPLADTIYALSSGRPPAAIAIVRISGPEAGATLAALAGRLPAPRHATLAGLRDAAGELLDRGLILWFPGPETATGEDLAELHLHGGRAVVESVLRALAERGLRLAEPGEFTRRALFNGRLDLAEVEGLADLLAAETERQRRDAMRRSEGAVGRRLAGWAAAVLDIAAQIEASIDYDGDVPADAMPHGAIRALIADLDAVIAQPPAERLRDGVRVAIIGPVNAGKSSLFNALVGSEAAIVSDRPGTTRDLIERPLSLGGIPIVLIDSAGLRDADDPIEREGVARAEALAASADLLLDLSGEAVAGPTFLAVSAKSDILSPRVGTLGVSVRTGEGLPELVSALTKMAEALLPPDGEVTFDRRYREGIVAARRALAQALGEDDSVLAAEHLREARSQFDRLTGNAGVEAMLDALFSGFCLGK